MSLVLFKCVAKALGNALGGGVVGDLLVEVLPDVAKDAWDWWSKDRSEKQRKDDVEALAQADAREVLEQAAAVVEEVVPDRPPAVKQAVQGYLAQIPAAIRRSMRRPSDPHGATVPPNLVPREADDLLKLLPTKMARFKPGDRPLPGVDWELEQLLGVGGFGEVWMAKNPHLHSAEPVALKFCLDATAARVLRNEAVVLDRVMRQGRHPGIVQLLRTYLSAETPCLEYEFVEGGDLTGLIQEWHRAENGPTPQQSARVMLRLAETVGFVHRLTPPIVHRDLKPANILIQRAGSGSDGSGGEPALKIADFGIGGLAVSAAIRETIRGTSRGAFLTSAVRGSYTPLYASPQQMRGERADPRDDVYALGVIWYQLLTGNLSTGRPGGTRWQKRLDGQGVPARLVELLASCFEDEPQDRLQDAATLADELAAVVKAAPKRKGTPSPIQSPVQSPGPIQVPSSLRELVYVDEASRNRAREIAATADEHRGRGDYDQAVALCNDALSLDPANARALWIRGEAHRMRGDHASAVVDCSESIRSDPSIWQAYYNRAEAYRGQSDYDHALPDYIEAIRLHTGFAWSYSGRGEAYRIKGNYDAAIADCTEALRLNPDIWQAYYNRGEAYRFKGNYDQTIADMSEAIKRHKSFAWIYSGRGEAYRMKSNYDAAIADCTDAIRLNGKIWQPYYNRAEAYRMKGDYDRALPDFSAAIRLHTGFAWTYSGRGEVHRIKGSYDAAIADCTEAIRMDPNIWQPYYNRGEAYRMKGNYEQAIADCSEAIRLAPGEYTPYASRGAAYRQIGDFTRALADLSESLRLNPSYQWARTQFDRARLRETAG
jgi:tetratricopeptide (TPR) repeat protein